VPQLGARYGEHAAQTIDAPSGAQRVQLATQVAQQPAGQRDAQVDLE